jgi:DivIVA domain-containing protein
VEPGDRPALDADEVAGHSFTRSRKGYDADEVRAYLVSLASQVRESNRLSDDLERRLAEVEKRAMATQDLDEESVTQMLGEETGRLLEAARRAAADIRSKAEEAAEALTADAAAQSTSVRSAADEYSRALRSEVDDHATRTRTEADEYALATRSSADADSSRVRSEADSYAAELRAAVDQEAAEARTAVAIEVDAIRTEAETVLADRTAEAEAAAAAIRADADAYDRQAREGADAYADTTRSTADTYRADVQGAADAYRDEARTEADRLRDEARADAEQVRSDADADAHARRVAADAEVEQLLADAREQGRTMVEEARTYRERVIADLADRRRAVKAQFEQLASTRDALAVTLTDVASRIDSSHRSLQDAVLDPREVGDLSVDRKNLEGIEEPVPVGVGVGELDAAAVADVDGDAVVAEADVLATDDAGAGDAAGDAAPDGDGAGVTEGEAATDEAVGAGEAEADRGQEPAADEPAAEAGEPEPAAGAEASPDDADAAEEGTGGDAAGAIFARIRADQGGASGDEPAGEALPKAGGPDAAEAAESSQTGDPANAPAAWEPSPTAPETEGEPTPVSGAATRHPGEAAVVDEATASADQDLLDRRDATTDELERQLARRLKRVLSDEQNEALDLLRRNRGRPDADQVLPTEADHLARYRDAALEDLRAAEREGAGFFGDAPTRKADVSDVATEFATEMVRQIRGRLERAFEDGGDENEVGERIRACYREWKTQRIADTAKHFVVLAFSRGLAEAAPAGAGFRWVLDDGPSPCPDCDDNTLAGAVVKGEEFPTGDLHPPAHPGCRCLTVPA